MLMLYYSPGACSLAVHIALLENAIPHELTKVDLHSHKVSSLIVSNAIPTMSLIRRMLQMQNPKSLRL